MRELLIDKLVHGGAGLARTDSGIVFVSGVLPGERVAAVETGKRGGCTLARPCEILAPSPSRRVPPCQYAGICGGCDWQHLAYEAQLTAKRAVFADCLQRIAKLNELPALEAIPSEEWRYRLRAQLRIDRSNGAVGFCRGDSTQVVDISDCPVLAAPLNGLLARRASLPARTPAAATRIKVIAGEQGEVASAPVIDGCTKDSVEIAVGSARFTVSGGSFFQGNVFLAERLGAWARPWVGGDFFLDLYGGVGFFSVMLGARFSRGILIDDVTSQVSLARDNLRENGIAAVEAHTASVEGFLARAAATLPHVDCLIVDPPRAGLTPAARKAVGAVRPSVMLYVACDPATQARDVGFFVKQCGYVIARAALFDLYPQTHHLETAILLTAAA